MFKKNLVLISIIVLLLLPNFAFAINIPGWPLVPCGLSEDNLATPDIHENNPCGRCDLFQLLKNLVDFVTGGLMPPLATLFFVWGGFLILLSGANPGLYAKGQEIFKNTFYGVMVLLAAWMITNTLILGLGASYNNAANWWEFVCVEPAPVSPPIVTAPKYSCNQNNQCVRDPNPSGQYYDNPNCDRKCASVVTGNSQAKANELISAIGLGSFSATGDCGSNFNSKQNIQDIAAGRFPAVCSSTCSSTNLCVAGGTSGNITVDASLLEGLIQLKKRDTNFTVTSFTTGKHSTNSSHYSGHGVDIVVNPDVPSDWIIARDFLDSLGGNAICEDKNGRVDSDCSPIPSVVDHIHWTK